MDDPFTAESIRAAVAVLEANDVRRGVDVPEGHEMILGLVADGQVSVEVLSSEVWDRLRNAFADLGRQLTRLSLGPMAAPRKRPRRIARKIAARDGRSRFQKRWR
jgi:hypothetical protein